MWPYTHISNCVRPAFLALEKKKKRELQKVYISFCENIRDPYLENFICLCNMSHLFSAGFINLMYPFGPGRCLEKVKSTEQKPETSFSENNHQIKPLEPHPSCGVRLWFTAFGFGLLLRQIPLTDFFFKFCLQMKCSFQYKPVCSLRSSTGSFLVVPKSRLKSKGDFFFLSITFKRRYIW